MWVEGCGKTNGVQESLKSTIFTLIAAIFQGFTLVWYILSYVPGGERGLFFMTSLFTSFLRGSTTSTVLPI
uniref:Ovule protein n=1 Tax=Caenorhabditis tropicalis TaxID=1561998 RepID=A0A1I7UYU7_9PELO